MPTPKEVQFSDLNITFNAHPVTGQLSVLKNNDAIIRAVKNIVFTNRFEKRYQPFFGGNIRAKLFEPLDELSLFEIKKDIERALQNFEPRVFLEDVRATPDFDGGRVTVTLVFSVINQADPVEATVILERVR